MKMVSVFTLPSFYVPNFEDDEGAYLFEPSVRLSVCGAFLPLGNSRTAYVRIL